MAFQKIKLQGSAEIGGVRMAEGSVIELDAEHNVVRFNGQKLELGLTTADVHDPTELQTYLAGYSNEEFRWQDACPVVLVDKDEDKYRTFNSDAAFKPVPVKTDDNANIPEVVVQSSLTNYKVVVRRLGAFIPDTVATQVSNPGYDVRFVHLDRAARAINMDLCLDILGPSGTGLLTTKSNWTAANATTLLADYQWNGGSKSNPIADLRARINASAQRITDWFMNQEIAGFMLDNPAFRDYTRAVIGDSALNTAIKATYDAGQATIDFTVPALGTFHVCGAKATQSDGTLAYIMPSTVIGTHNVPGSPMSPDKIATAKNFRRRGPAGNGFNTREIRLDWRGAGGTLVIAEEASVPTFTGTIVGGYIDSVKQ